jgi:hypothetical protein
MSKLGFIMPVVIAATLGAGALYLSSGNDEPKNTPKEQNEVEMRNVSRPQSSVTYSPPTSSPGQEAYIGGLTKRNKNKNKHMKKKSRSSRRNKNQKNKIKI